MNRTIPGSDRVNVFVLADGDGVAPSSVERVALNYYMDEFNLTEGTRVLLIPSSIVILAKVAISTLQSAAIEPSLAKSLEVTLKQQCITRCGRFVKANSLNFCLYIHPHLSASCVDV